MQSSKLKFPILFSGVLFASFLQIGCSGNPSRSKTSDGGKPAPFTGDLIELVDKLYNKTIFKLSSCDSENRDRVIVITTALQSKKDEIDALRKSIIGKESETDQGKYTKIGKYSFRKPTKNVTEDKWETTSYDSWIELEQIYNKIKDTNVSKDWIALDSEVRGMMTDENDRMNSGVNYSLGKDSKEKIAQISKALRECLNNSECLAPNFSEDQKNYFAFGYREAELYSNTIDPDKTSSQRRRRLWDLANELETDLDYYRFNRNTTARLDGDTLRVPFNASAFEEAAAQFKDVVESFWNNQTSSSLKLKIELDSKTENIFSLEILPGTGRAYVSPSHKTLNLYNGVKLKTLAHEFGHVIGFTDHYYTTYDWNTCKYNMEFNKGDIMSSSETGQVQAYHWKEILENYADKVK